MTSAPWWQTLQELPELPQRAQKGGRFPVQTPFSLERGAKTPQESPLAVIAQNFRALEAYLWELAPRKKPRCIEMWVDQSESLATDKPTPGAELTRLLQVALAQQRPLWIESPFTVEAGSNPSHDAIQYRLLTTMPSNSYRSLILEIRLASPNQIIAPEVREIYLRATCALSQQGFDLNTVERIASDRNQKANHESLSSSPKIARGLSTIDFHSIQRTLDEQRSRTIRLLERDLAKFEGLRFESMETNQAFASQLHQLLDGAGLRVICPQCGQPSILRCLVVGNSTAGAFVFDHYLDKVRTFHGGRSTLPRLFLTAKPPRRVITKND
jgi:hypothetical protein